MSNELYQALRWQRRVLLGIGLVLGSLLLGAGCVLVAWRRLWS